eukprot:TRINITY_DN10088_c0_g1_i1.p1 TRINITY_DN10088_c0_g1~~TRINITY_DN10088_c0_g1_i1.p1  ORF type:complete len:176 (+),score=5.87 TRINITY_DN10088_c0_g1_i1:131-658(+)
MQGQRVGLSRETGLTRNLIQRKNTVKICNGVYGLDDLQISSSGYKYYHSSLLTLSEQRSTDVSGYQYYELVVDRGQQSGYGQFYPVHFNNHHAGMQIDLVSPLLAVVVVLSGIYTAGAATFGWNFHLTKFDYDKRPQLVFLWPYLFLMNNDFRNEFKQTILGKQQFEKIDMDQYL